VKLEKAIVGTAKNLGMGFSGALVAALAGADLVAVLMIGVVVCAATVLALEQQRRWQKGKAPMSDKRDGAQRRRKTVGILQTGGTSNYDTTVMQGLDVGIDQTGGDLKSKRLLIGGPRRMPKNRRQANGGRYTPKKRKTVQTETLPRHGPRGIPAMRMSPMLDYLPVGMNTISNCSVLNCCTGVLIDGGTVLIDGLDVVDCGTGIEQNGGRIEGRNITITNRNDGVPSN
jgi:hypothetical protein